jgi:hypothetical protein
VAQAAEAAPSKPLRVIFIVVFSRAHWRAWTQFPSKRRHSQGGQIARGFPYPSPGDETILRNPRNHPETGAGYGCRQQRGEGREEADMNHSFHSADRSTHLKIVVIALVAGIVVAGLGISARTMSDYTQTAHVVKAGKPVAVTNSDTMMVR